MSFTEPLEIRRRSASETSVVPMINVAFLLIIFFLMSSTLVPEQTADVDLPLAVTGKVAGEGKELVVAADGSVAWGALRGEAAFEALGDVYGGGAGGLLVIKADKAVEGAAIARILARIGAIGVTESALVTGS
ncbi:MAG: biopolymer transporter ExbD [Pseudomonadota bacterium]